MAKEGLPELLEKAEDAPALDRATLFIGNYKFMCEVLKDVAPKGPKVLDANFDAVIARFKTEYAKTP